MPFEIFRADIQGVACRAAEAALAACAGSDSESPDLHISGHAAGKKILARR
jgi:hypothetical protein